MLTKDKIKSGLQKLPDTVTIDEVRVNLLKQHLSR